MFLVGFRCEGVEGALTPAPEGTPEGAHEGQAGIALHKTSVLMIATVTDQGSACAAPSASPGCLFVTVDDGKNRLSVRMLRLLDVALFQEDARSDTQRIHSVCICKSAQVARLIRGKSVVAVYDTGEYDGFYSTGYASKIALGKKPDWVGDEGFVVGMKLGIHSTRRDVGTQILQNRLANCARQLSSTFAKLGRVPDEYLFGIPKTKWDSPAPVEVPVEQRSRVRMKSDQCYD